MGLHTHHTLWSQSCLQHHLAHQVGMQFLAEPPCFLFPSKGTLHSMYLAVCDHNCSQWTINDDTKPIQMVFICAVKGTTLEAEDWLQFYKFSCLGELKTAFMLFHLEKGTWGPAIKFDSHFTWPFDNHHSVLYSTCTRTISPLFRRWKLRLGIIF